MLLQVSASKVKKIGDIRTSCFKSMMDVDNQCVEINSGEWKSEDQNLEEPLREEEEEEDA